MTTAKPTVDIVIPVFNEEECVDDLVARIRRACPQGRLIFVDNASTDSTAARLARHQVEVLRHASNEGYGKSLRDGMAFGSGDLIVQIDADLEYPPEAIPEIVDRLMDHAAVFGSRFLGRAASEVAGLRGSGNRLITRIFNLLYSQRLTDLYTGIRAVRREAIEPCRFRRDGFEFVIELASCCARLGHIIHEVPVDYNPRSGGASKMRHVREGLKALYWLVRLRFSPLGPQGGLESRDR